MLTVGRVVVVSVGVALRAGAGVLAALGYAASGANGELSFARGPERRGSKRRRRGRPASPHSPFAGLRRLVRS